MGLLPVPQRVRELVARERAKLLEAARVEPSREAEKLQTDALTLQYYYEGFDVAYRPTASGVEVLAVGHEDIGRLVREIDDLERMSIVIGQP